MPNGVSRLMNKLDLGQNVEIAPKKAAKALIAAAKIPEVMAAATADKMSPAAKLVFFKVADQLELRMPVLQGILTNRPIPNVATDRGVRKMLDGLKERAASPNIRPEDALLVGHLMANIEEQQAAVGQKKMHALAHGAIERHFAAAEAHIRKMQMQTIRPVNVTAEALGAVEHLEKAKFEVKKLPEAEHAGILGQIKACSIQITALMAQG